MIIPEENLNIMVQYLTDISETSGDHFMRAADMLRAQQARITELESLVAKGPFKNLRYLRSANSALRLEAQIHAQEARTANATIAEIYQLVTGATGEPGNWNGAEPVRKKLAALEAQAAIGQRAVVDATPQPYDDCLLLHNDGSQRIGRMDRKRDCWRLARYQDCKAGSEVIWSLTDVVRAIPVLRFAEPAAVAVDAGNLEALRNRLEVFDLAKLDPGLSFFTARSEVIEAARRLLEGGE